MWILYGALIGIGVGAIIGALVWFINKKKQEKAEKEEKKDR